MAKINISSIIKNKLKEKEEEKKEKEETQNSQEKENPVNSESNQSPTNDTSSQSKPNDNKTKTEIEEKPTEKIKSAQELLSDLKNIENKYSQNDYVDAPEELDLSLIEIPNKENEDFLKEAKQSLESKYETKKDTTQKNFSKKVDEILSKTEELKNKAKENSLNITEIYNNSIKETEDQALKRGLARSSIIINQIAGLEGEKASELSNILNTLDQNLKANELSISSLKEEKDIALENLDIEYAIELQNKIDQLEEEYLKEKNNAIEFNNNVKKLQAEYKLNLDKQKQSKQENLTELENKYDTEYTKNKIATEQYKYLKNYFDLLDKNDAISIFLTNKNFKDILGDRYVEMYKYLKNK